MTRKDLKLQERGMTLTNRITWSFTGLIALAMVIALTLAYLNFRAQFRSQLTQRLLDIVSVAALQQNGDAFITIHSADDAAYKSIQAQNLKIRSAALDLRFLYTMRYDANGVYFVVDATNPGETGFSPYGTRYEQPGPVLAANYQTIDHAMAETNFYTDEYGTFLSAYAPFYTSQGQLAGIIGADISAANVIARENQVLVQFILLFVLIVPLLGLAGRFLGIQLANPIESITSTAKRFSENDFNYRPPIKTTFPEVKILRDTLFSMADQLLSFVSSMEERIADRTASLEKRGQEIQAASLIARDTSTAPNMEEMLERAASLIETKFGYYHTGIYIIDDNNEFAVLKAAGGEAGQLMIKRNYKVRVGEADMVGEVAKTGNYRVINDAAAENMGKKNTLLPYTRAEITIPLMSGNRVIGILDIQGDKTNTFDANTISILQVVTDQLSVNIERSQLLERLQQNSQALELALQENTTRTWRSFLERNRGALGYQYDGVTFESLAGLSMGNTKNIENATSSQIIKDPNGKASYTLEVPVSLRGQILGMLNVKFQASEVPLETIHLVEQAADRLALAMENARLVQDAQRLATRERQINAISAQAQQSTNLEALLQNTVRELGNTLGLPKTFIQIGLLDREKKQQ